MDIDRCQCLVERGAGTRASESTGESQRLTGVTADEGYRFSERGQDSRVDGGDAAESDDSVEFHGTRLLFERAGVERSPRHAKKYIGDGDHNSRELTVQGVLRETG